MSLPFARLLALLALLLAAGRSHAQTINTEAATAYWHLTDALRRDEPLTDAAWQQFLRLPDNRVYVDAVWGSDTASLRRYRRAIEVVYRPRYDSLRQAKIKAGSWYYILVDQYKQHEPEDRAFLSSSASNPNYLEKMYTYAYNFLPARNHTTVAKLHLAYVALGNDATSQEEGIVFSVRDVRNYEQFPGLLEAHEMHHQLRTGKNFGTVAPADKGLLWAFESAQNEGLADLIDKRVLVEQADDSADVRAWLLKSAPGVVHQIDSTIQVQAAGRGATPLKFYRQLTNGSNGHLPGFYMAYTIVRAGYRRQLLDHADDPLTFALLYQKAAKKSSSAPHFSAASERYLKQLVRKYAKPRQAAKVAS